MNKNLIIERLTKNFNYEEYNIDDQKLNVMLRDRGLEVWINDSRCMVTKEFNSAIQLEDWHNDQIIISFLHDLIPSKFKNNLYFLLSINLDQTEFTSSMSTINEIEKDSKVCRKYVLKTLSDLQRVPSLSEFSNTGESYELFDFDKAFKDHLFGDEDDNPILEFSDFIDLYLNYYNVEEETIVESKNEILKKIINERAGYYEIRKVNN
ncbi:ABC-three component system middle component 1 [Alkalihalobacillus sp. FSL W8-0930]